MHALSHMCARFFVCFWFVNPGQSKRFRPTDSNPGSRTSTSRRPMAMGAAGAQRHRGGSRGTNKRQIRWNGRQLDVQLHKTIVVKVLVRATIKHRQFRPLATCTHEHIHMHITAEWRRDSQQWGMAEHANFDDHQFCHQVHSTQSALCWLVEMQHCVIGGAA